jgi:hypothetical protein
MCFQFKAQTLKQNIKNCQPHRKIGDLVSISEYYCSIEVIGMSSLRRKVRLTEFGKRLDRLLDRLKEPMSLTDYADLTGLSYKYISQLRTNPDRRPGSYAVVKILKPFIDFEVLTLVEASQFSKIIRGKVLTLGECRTLFPGTDEKDLLQAINSSLQPEDHTATEANEIKIIENDYSVPITVIEYIEHENPQVVKMLEHNATYGRHYIDAIKTLDPKIKEIRLLIHNPLEQLLSELQKERICQQIRTLKLVDFKNEVLKIRCYNQRASLRGRKFDDELIVLGWYAFYYDPSYPEYGKNQMWGHNNALIVARLGGQGKYLGEMFDRVFDSLWNDPDNPSLLTVCTRQCKLYRAGVQSTDGSSGCSVSEEWLKKVSG